MEEVSGTLAQVRYHSGDFMIGVLDDGRTVKGNVLAPRVGSGYRFFGRWENHSRWGPQFVFQDFVATAPATNAAIRSYLIENVPGVGVATANALIERYGTDTLAICKGDPARVAAEVAAVSQQKAERISAALREIEATEQREIRLKELFAGTHVGRRPINQIIALYGADAVARIEADPYTLIDEITGIGFETADAVARRCGIAPESPSRIRAGVAHVLKEAAQSGGHTCLPGRELLDAVTQLLGVPEHLVAEQLKAQFDEGDLVLDREKRIGLRHFFQCERLIAEKLLAILANQVTEPEPDLSGLMADQVEAMCMAVKHGVVVLTGAPGVGKAQPLDAKILTPTGWKTMATIRYGNTLVDPVGGLTRVIGVFPQGEKEMFRVVFSDGSRIECCKEHLWLTRRRDRRKKRQPQTYTLQTLEEIIASLKAADGASNHAIPMVTPLELGTGEPLPVDPYLLGLLLGDGCFSDRHITWSNPEQELVSALQELLPSGVVLTQLQGIDYALRKTSGGRTNNLYAAIRELGLWGKRSHQKHIPQRYLFSSVRSRIALLQGLMDTDGTRSGHSPEFSTSSPRLAEDFKFLIQSLGGTARVLVRSPRYTHNGEARRGRLAYRTFICLPLEIVPFRLSRKKAAHVPNSRYLPRRIIRAVEYVGIKPAQCIQVDSPSGLYVTDDCIVTHNTYTIRRILSTFPDLDIALAAPTGRAAKRIEEQTGHPASTIHRLLEPQPSPRGGFAFTRNEQNPIDADLIVADEQSMTDVSLMAAFLRAVRPSTRLILVGDHYQLPSVGPGNVLRDLIESGQIPSAELTLVKRQDEGVIVRNCHATKAGRSIDTSNDPDGDFFFVAEESEERIRATILDLVARRLPETYGLDPVADIMVISPRRSKVRLACDAMNPDLQELLNANPPVDRLRFRIGDRVIQTRNSYSLGVMNGDLGRVLAIDTSNGGGRPGAGRSITVQFDNPLRTVSVPLYDNDLELAYALTVHKCQGSEFEAVVMPVHSSFGYLVMQRNLLYTAISRAKRLCVLVGQREQVSKMIGRNAPQHRHTRLRDLLVEMGATR